MKIRVLGCSGAELPGHNLSGFLLDGTILFDAGSAAAALDRRGQSKIGHIFITHAHLDHIRGIPFLADNITIERRRQQVAVISIPPVLRTIRKNLLNNALWPDFSTIPDHESAVLRYIPLAEGQALAAGDFSITPYRVHHSVPAVGYLVEDRRKRRFFYTGDTGPTPATWKKLGDRPLHGLIIEVSFPNRMSELAVTTGHLSPLLLKEELGRLPHLPETIYITHLKPQLAGTIKKELDKLNLRNLRLLRKGETITL